MRVLVRSIVAVVGGLSVFVSLAIAAPPPARPVTNLQIVADASPDGASRADGARRPLGAMLVLNALSESARLDLAHRLARLAAALERRRNPLFVALEEGAERSEALSLTRDLGPMFAAASSLSAGRWTSSDGDLTVRGAARCARDGACIPLVGAARRDGVEGRARFLAWPIGFAIVVRAAAPREEAAITAALRDRRALDSTIALALTGADLRRLRGGRALDELTRDAARVLHAGGQGDAAFAALLGAIVDAPRARGEVAWLRLPPGAVLIVPRLGALATIDAFVSETRALLAPVAARQTWLMSPSEPP